MGRTSCNATNPFIKNVTITMEISNNDGVQKCHPIDIQLLRVIKVDQYDNWPNLM